MPTQEENDVLLSWYWLQTAFAAGQVLNRVQFYMGEWVTMREGAIGDTPRPENWCGTACCAAGLAIVCNIGGSRPPLSWSPEEDEGELHTAINHLKGAVGGGNYIHVDSASDFYRITRPSAYYGQVRGGTAEITPAMVADRIAEILLERGIDISTLTPPENPPWKGRTKAFE